MYTAGLNLSQFASFFSRSLYQDDLIVKFTNHFKPLLPTSVASLSFASFFWFKDLDQTYSYSANWNRIKNFGLSLPSPLQWVSY